MIMTNRIITLFAGTVLPLPVLFYTLHMVKKTVAAAAAEGAGAPWLFANRAAGTIAAVFVSLTGAIAACRLVDAGAPALVQVKLGIAFMVLLASAVYDSRFRTIPNVLPLILVLARALILAGEFVSGAAPVPHLISSIAGALAAAGTLAAASKLTKGGVGAGDVKLIAAIGFMCGLYAVFAVLLLAVLSCAITAVPLLLTKRKTISGNLPFAPFIYIGMAAVISFSLY